MQYGKAVLGSLVLNVLNINSLNFVSQESQRNKIGLQ